MKTLKELLFERHRAAEADLDCVRGEFLVRLGRLQTPVPRERRGLDLLLRRFIFPLRWHVAGMGAAWLVVLLLNVDASPTPAARVAKEKTPPPQQFLAALRQNRREILELTESPPIAPILLPQRRGEVPTATAIG